MGSIGEISEAFRSVMTTVATEIARQTGCVRRRSKLSGALLVQTLVLGWWRKPDASLGELGQMAASLGVTISPQGLDQRFTQATAACLRQVLETAAARVLVAAEPVALPLLQRFPAVVVLDSTTISLPAALVGEWEGCRGGKGGGEAALKVQVGLDLVRGALVGPLLADGRADDRASAPPPETFPAGGLRLADLGYFSLEELRDLAARGGCWVTRLQAQTAVFVDGRRRDLGAWLPAAAAEGLDVAVELGVRARLPARLLAIPVPPVVAASRRRVLRATAREQGRTPSHACLARASWTILVTNLAPERLSLAEALVLARARWQIELLFKLWKQYGQVDTWRSRNPWRILCEVYAKLVALLLQHWMVLLGGWSAPDRSLVKAAQVARALVPLLAAALTGLLELLRALEHFHRCLAAAGRLNRRRAAPNTYQLLLDPALNPHLATLLTQEQAA